MRKSGISKIKDVLARPNMFLVKNNLDYAIAFFSGIDCAYETKPLSGFHNWLIDNYFSEPLPFAWEVLIYKLPCCASDDIEGNVRKFLGVIGDYLDFSEQ